METKICARCKGDPKPISEFYFSESRNRYICYCNDCQEIKQKEYRKRNKDKKIRNRLNRKYGITPEDRAELLRLQDDKCAICGIEEKFLIKGLYIDHDHETGEIRGLLCSSCNTALGLLKEDINSLKKVIKYLKSRKSHES